MRVTVNITRRPEIADPEGRTVARALHDLGHTAVREVRVDRTIHLDVDGDDRGRVEAEVVRMCESVLANPVIEDFEVVVA
jgi:phosphoribosylformylglycinamidine synthase subunit PurS